MVEGRMGVLWTCTVLLALASAGPLHRYPRDSEDYQNIDLSAYANFTANEVCFSDNEVFQKGDVMPNPGPCEECRCEPPSIVCNMIKCPVNNNGCRTIQRANHCCPDYNCECDYNGQLYNDGERVDTPEESCQVCYCKGGDVMCTSITCYQRDDCEPLHVPGQCCPKYKNCPIRDEASNSDDKSVRTRSPSKTSNNSPKREMQPWLLTKSAHQTSSFPGPKQTATPEDTTEVGNVIIVSDWLTERRTTTEDGFRHQVFSFDHTDGPLIVTDPDHLFTVQQSITYNTDGSSLVRNSETITPVDEVIFTRVDMLRDNQEQQVATSSPLPTTLFKETVTTNPPIEPEDNDKIHFSTKNTVDDKTTITSDNSTPDQENNVQLNFSSHKMTQEEIRSSLNIDIEEESDSLSVTTAGSTTLPETDTTNSIIIDLNKKALYVTKESEGDALKEVTVNHLDGETQTTLVEHTTRYNFKQDDKINHSFEKNQEENKTNIESHLDIVTGSTGVEPSEDIIFEHLFGLDRLDEDRAEDTTANEPITVKDNMTLVTIQQIKSNVHPATTNQQPTEKFESYTSRDDINDNSLANESKYVMTQKNEEVKLSTYDITANSVVREHNSNDEVTLAKTETSLDELESTTPYFTEDHMSRLNIDSLKLVPEDSNKDEETTYEEGSTTDSLQNPTTALVGLVKSDHEMPFEKIIESNEENLETDNSLNIDTTTFDYTTLVDVTTTDQNSPLVTEETTRYNANSIAEDITYDVKESADIIDTGKSNVLGNGDNIVSKNNIKIDNITNDTEKTSIKIFAGSPESSIQEDGSLITFNKEDGSNKSREAMSNVPPVLELNSHFPFLQLGGHVSSDGYSIALESDQETTMASLIKEDKSRSEYVSNLSMGTLKRVDVENLSDDNLSISSTTVQDEMSKYKGIKLKETEEPFTETQTETVATTSHIPLTPGDLKALAEYLINEKIKPVNTKHESVYAPNQWLKGNLTSEEKMASILSAANISIGIMNHSDLVAKTILPETSTRSNEVVTMEKFEKEPLSNGNNALESVNSVVNKTGYLHTKYVENQEFPKSYMKSQTVTSDGRELVNKTPLEPTLEISKPKTQINAEINTALGVNQSSFKENAAKDSIIEKNNSDEVLNEKLEEHTPSPIISNENSELVLNITKEINGTSQMSVEGREDSNPNLNEDGHANVTIGSETNKSPSEKVTTSSDLDDIGYKRPKEILKKHIVTT